MNKYKEYYKLYRNNSDILFIWFGGINEPFFSEGFSNLSGFDCLYFRDTDLDWYSNGAFRKESSQKEFLEFLKNQSMNYNFICCCGQSSGGYAALNYSILINADLCIAFSPQTKNTFDGQCHMTPHVRIKNITDLFNESLHRPRVILNVPRSENNHKHEFQWHDHAQISELKTLDKVTTIIHPYDDHAVSSVLREKNILYKLLISLVKLNRDI